MYHEEDGRVVNDAGQVAISYYQTIPQNIQVSGKQYSFSVRNNICMAWIEPEHVDTVLAIKRQCCPGSSPKNVYRLEHLAHVRRWMGDASR